ncbi:MAG: hypothetical protein GY774_07000 [Planctomycetes bacterium]|nr:hypothetical protein [Planctomycetota bacterium]
MDEGKKDALRVNFDKKLKPDIAVMDFSLPVSGAVNVARKIKNHYPNLKSIGLSIRMKRN